MNKLSSAVTLVSFVLVASAHAVDVVGPIAGAPGWTGLARDASTVGVSNSPSTDGNGSLVLTTPSTSKALAYYTTTGTLPTLGDLKNGTFTFDYLKDASSTTAGNVAVKLFFQNTAGSLDINGTQLTWENEYNGSPLSTGTLFNDFNVASGNWWIRSGGTNFNGGSQAHSLGYWAAGGAEGSSVTLSDSTPILGYGFQFGSGVSGTFAGAVDDLKINYTGASARQSLAYSFGVQATPEPSAMAALGLGAVALVRRRRKA